MGCTWNSKKALRKMVAGMRIACDRTHTRLESSTPPFANCAESAAWQRNCCILKVFYWLIEEA